MHKIINPTKIQNHKSKKSPRAWGQVRTRVMYHLQVTLGSAIPWYWAAHENIYYNSINSLGAPILDQTCWLELCHQQLGARELYWPDHSIRYRSALWCLHWKGLQVQQQFQINPRSGRPRCSTPLRGWPRHRILWLRRVALIFILGLHMLWPRPGHWTCGLHESLDWLWQQTQHSKLWWGRSPPIHKF